MAVVVQDGHLALEALEGALLHLAVLAHLDGHRLALEHTPVHSAKGAAAGMLSLVRRACTGFCLSTC